MPLPIVQEPVNLFSRPFANQGLKTIPPDDNAGTDGRASLTQGFPPITQVKPELGGLPPQRADFNGVYFMLSAFAYWQQSGGLMSYKTSLQYSPRCMVTYNDDVYMCIKANGVDTAAGTKTPSVDTDYWITFFEYILKNAQSSGAASSLGVPVGTILMYGGKNIPSEGTWLFCNGQSCTQYPKLVEVLGENTVPNMSGRFPQGADSTNLVGSTIEAGLPNITGSFVQGNYSGNFTKGAFYQTGQTGGPCANKSDWRYLGFFDASRVSPVYGRSTTVQPPAQVVNYIIKAE